MRLLFLAFALLLIFYTTNAQTRFGLKGGIGASYIKSDNNKLRDFDKARTSGFFGATLEMFANKRFSIQPEVGYAHEVATETYYGSLLTLGYIQLPVLLKYTMPINSVSFYLGPQVNFLTKATLKLNGQSSNIKDDVAQTDFGVVAGIGYVGQKTPISFDIRAYQGLINVFKDEFEDGTRSRNVVISATLGYVWGSSKK